MASPRTIKVVISADTRQLQRSLIDAQLLMPGVSFWRRLSLRISKLKLRLRSAP